MGDMGCFLKHCIQYTRNVVRNHCNLLLIDKLIAGRRICKGDFENFPGISEMRNRQLVNFVLHKFGKKRAMSGESNTTGIDIRNAINSLN